MLKNTETSGTSPVRRLFMLFIGSDRKVRFYNELRFSRKSYSRNRQEISLKPAARLVEDGVWVPLDAFCKLIDVEAKVLEDGGPLAVCRDDLCIPLNGVEQDTVSFDGTLYAALKAFGEPLGLKWSVEGDMLNVTSGNGERVGLGIGHRPPAFTLPDLYTGEPVSLSDYRGKKTVFYMWASW